MRVRCPECRVDFAVGLLLTHRQSQHGMVQDGQGWGTPPPPHPTHTPLPGGPGISGLLPVKSVATPAPSRRVNGWGIKPYQPSGSLCAPPYEGNDCDPREV